MRNRPNWSKPNHFHGPVAIKNGGQTQVRVHYPASGGPPLIPLLRATPEHLVFGFMGKASCLRTSGAVTGKTGCM
jgi:hypothetical protein